LRGDIIRNNYIILGVLLIVFSSLFLVGCYREEEISYEIISFEDAPEEVQNRIIETDGKTKEREVDRSAGYVSSTIISSGNIDLGKERYVYFVTNREENKKINEVIKITEVGPFEDFGTGAVVKFATEHRENVEFPDTVTIVKFIEYYGRIQLVKAAK